MFKKSVLINLFALFVLGAMTYAIKQRVIQIDDELMVVQREIVHYQESMHILNAEWAFLTNPQRLQALVDDNFDMNQSHGLALVGFDDVYRENEGSDYQGCHFPDPIRLASASITPAQKPHFRGQVSARQSVEHEG